MTHKPSDPRSGGLNNAVLTRVCQPIYSIYNGVWLYPGNIYRLSYDLTMKTSRCSIWKSPRHFSGISLYE